MSFGFFGPELMVTPFQPNPRMPLRQGGIINSRRAASPFVWLVEGLKRWDAPDHHQVFSLKIGGGNEPSHMYGAQSYG
ncbi:hypothetical protein TNCV_3591041 [Trichonephila clavipes]|nr:hypothetical protein TNCV_3591041 [Trichonephila clavipes]